MTEQVLVQTRERPSALSAYISTAKLGIVGLTLVAALTGIYFGNHGILPDWSVIFWTFLTLGLATAGSCMINNVYDRDIDRVMKRTSGRVMALDVLPVKQVTTVAVLMCAGSVAMMAYVVNPLAALTTAVGVIGYAVVYTMMTKRTTPWANQLGGIAGAVPPMVGYAAVTGELGAPAWILFAIMVVWQQPHALALALKYREDYARANVPVIPVACGVFATKVRIAVYTAVLVPVATLPYFFEMAGIYYLATSIVLSAIFLFTAVRFLLSDRDCDMRVFAFSLIYFVLLFSALVFDAV
ncbi:MAG: heme o synthase [Mariprofundaceae bacterium]|nr:heme o synthase [Mariprofundaceae bacterium]